MEEVLKDVTNLLQNGEPEEALLLLNQLSESTTESEQLKTACKQVLSQQYWYFLREAQKDEDFETARNIADKYNEYIGEDERISQLLEETKSKHEEKMAELAIAERQKYEKERLNKKAEIKEHYKKIAIANAFPIGIGVVTLSLLLGIFVFRAPYLEQKRDLQIISDGISEREEINNQLVANIQDKSKELAKLEEAFLEGANRLEDKVPIVITDIKIGAAIDDPNEITTPFGNTLYSDKSTFLVPQITFYGLKDSNVELRIKWYDMWGQLMPDWPYSKGPRYYVSKFECEKDMSVIATLDGWGSNGYSWGSGTYRIEIWFKDLCLKKQYVTIY